MTTAATTIEKSVTEMLVWNGQIKVHTTIAGKGPNLVFFHPAAGLIWDPFMDDLASRFRVHAIQLPGTVASDPYEIHKIENFSELLLIYHEVITKLGLEGALAMGHSLGGMTVLDLAAHFPKLFQKIIAIAPAGLWDADCPVMIPDLYKAPPEQQAKFLFHDLTCPAVQKMAELPEDIDERAKEIAIRVWTMGVSAKFLWPFPDHGLNRRLHRVEAKVDLVWGKNDALVDVAYAEKFARLLKHSSIHLIDECGHIPQMEKKQAMLDIVNRVFG
jgi:pimeloyl-ACP methyl ester carboxylesterase